MDLLIKSISENPYLALIVEIATILSLIITIVIAVIQKKKKRLVYSCLTTLLVNDKLSCVEGLNITFNEREIEQLSVTSVSLVNKGNVIIEESDLHHNKALAIVPTSENCEIIDAKVIDQSSDTIDCSVSVTDNKVTVHYAAFEKKESASVNIYHTGNENSTFKMEGKIKEGNIDYLNPKEETASRYKSFLVWTLFVFLVIMGISFFVPIPYISIIAKAIVSAIMFLISCLFAIIVVIAVVTAFISRY